MKNFKWLIVVGLAGLVLPASAVASPGDAYWGDTLGSQSAKTAGAETSAAAVEAQVDAVRASWTRERMLAALPAGARSGDPEALALARVGSRAPGLQLLSASSDPVSIKKKKKKKKKGKAIRIKRAHKGINRLHGKVFFAVGGNDYVCSGSSVKAPSHSLVWTAGHCVSDAAKNLLVNEFIYVPGYKNGRTPLGVWPATKVAVTGGWWNSSGKPGRKGTQYDFGVAVVAPLNGKTLQQAVGARKILFKSKRNQKLKIFGYPAKAPPEKFNGQGLWRCNTKFRSSDSNFKKPYPLEALCDMTGGSSGGGWVNKNGKIVSVSSYKYDYRPRSIYGSYQGGAIKRFYKDVRNTNPLD